MSMYVYACTCTYIHTCIHVHILNRSYSALVCVFLGLTGHRQPVGRLPKEEPLLLPAFFEASMKAEELETEHRDGRVWRLKKTLSTHLDKSFYLNTLEDFILCACSCLHGCTCSAPHASSGCGEQERALDPLEPELQMFVSRHVGAVN